MVPKHLFLWVMSLALLLPPTEAASIAQYCNPVGPQSPLPFCVAANTHRNSSTEADDLVVTFGWQKPTSGGWAGIGLGSSMYGALMFVVFADSDADDAGIQLSVRSGIGHFEPKTSSNSPPVDTLRASIDKSSRLEISFVCYGYGNWRPRTDSSILQSWIWASNSQQKFLSADEDSTLSFHNLYGYFQLDMTDTLHVSNSIEIPPIQVGLPNQKLNGGDKSPQPSRFFPVHGLLMSAAMMIMMPLGAFFIRSDYHRAFAAHVGCQISAAVFCLAGAAVAVIMVYKTRPASAVSHPHILLGTLLVLLIILQLMLGYLHHINFKRSRRVRTVTLSHVWIGRFLIIGGCVNTFLGVGLAGSRANFIHMAILSLTVIDGVFVSYMSVEPLLGTIRWSEKLNWWKRDDVPFAILAESDEEYSDSDSDSHSHSEEQKQPR